MIPSSMTRLLVVHINKILDQGLKELVARFIFPTVFCGLWYKKILLYIYNERVYRDNLFKLQ